jgi:hypothetical protein
VLIEGPRREVLSSVTIRLSRDQAGELADKLNALLARPYSEGDHEHVSSDDYRTEVTVWLEPPA